MSSRSGSCWPRECRGSEVYLFWSADSQWAPTTHQIRTVPLEGFSKEGDHSSNKNSLIWSGSVQVPPMVRSLVRTTLTSTALALQMLLWTPWRVGAASILKIVQVTVRPIQSGTPRDKGAAARPPAGRLVNTLGCRKLSGTNRSDLIATTPSGSHSTPVAAVVCSSPQTFPPSRRGYRSASTSSWRSLWPTWPKFSTTAATTTPATRPSTSAPRFWRPSSSRSSKASRPAGETTALDYGKETQRRRSFFPW